MCARGLQRAARSAFVAARRGAALPVVGGAGVWCAVYRGSCAGAVAVVAPPCCAVSFSFTPSRRRSDDPTAADTITSLWQASTHDVRACRALRAHAFCQCDAVAAALPAVKPTHPPARPCCSRRRHVGHRRARVQLVDAKVLRRAGADGRARARGVQQVELARTPIDSNRMRAKDHPSWRLRNFCKLGPRRLCVALLRP